MSAAGLHNHSQKRTHTHTHNHSASKPLRTLLRCSSAIPLLQTEHTQLWAVFIPQLFSSETARNALFVPHDHNEADFKAGKKRKEKGLINESQSLCISVWTWKCLVCVCKMIYTVEFSVPPQWVLNAEVVSHVCAKPAANKQWGCIRFSQKVPVYKATVMSCWCRINATTPYLAVRLGVILSFMSHLSENQGWQGFTSFMLISSETNKQKRII